MNRRRVLTAAVTAGTLGVAGCLGGDGDGQDDADSGDESDTGDPNADGGPATDEDPPVAAAFNKTGEQRTDATGRSLTRVNFTAAPSEGNIVAYRWDFTDDGSIDETGETVQHLFGSGGELAVTLEVEDEDGNTDTTTREIAIDVGPPVRAAFSWDEVRVGEETTLDASESTGDIAEYRWDFTDDGSVDETTTDPVTTYTLDEQRTLTVTLEVEDTAGTVDSTTQDLVEPSDIVSAGFQVLGNIRTTGIGITFDARVSTGEAAEYRWDFDGDGSIDDTTTDTVVNHVFENPGYYDVALVVEGPVGTDSTSEELAIGFPIDVSVETPAPGEQVAFDASQVDADQYRWDFTGDGEFDKVTLDPVASYTFEEEGTYPVSLEAQQANTAVPGFVLVDVQSLK
jgi:PKD repeat protein